MSLQFVYYLWFLEGGIKCFVVRPCKGTTENLRAWPEFVWTPTQATGILVARTSSLSVRRL